MSAINTGGPAFPVADFDHQTFAPKTVEETRRLLSGMSLRDYFAAKAMHALMVDPMFASEVQAKRKPVAATIAATSYAMADAMLIARDQS